MKTIAISIDEATLADLDRLARSAEKSSSRRKAASGNRSKIVREALCEFLKRQEEQKRDQRDRKVYAEHRRLIARQARALVGEQAEP
jgi:metal-responsive CopG/Arc/MetJ family transcriptional regulator